MIEFLIRYLGDLFVFAASAGLLAAIIVSIKTG